MQWLLVEEAGEWRVAGQWDWGGVNERWRRAECCDDLDLEGSGGRDHSEWVLEINSKARDVKSQEEQAWAAPGAQLG